MIVSICSASVTVNRAVPSCGGGAGRSGTSRSAGPTSGSSTPAGAPAASGTTAGFSVAAATGGGAYDGPSAGLDSARNSSSSSSVPAAASAEALKARHHVVDALNDLLERGVR